MPTTKASLHQSDHPETKVNSCPLPSLSSVERFIVELRPGLFLKNYYDDLGLTSGYTLSEAKQFKSFKAADSVTLVLGIGTVRRVFVDEHGNHVRIALLPRKEYW